MRTIIDLPQEYVDELAILGKTDNKSRSALIREAIQEYITSRRRPPMTTAFGIWKSRNIDGLAYEASIREEWETE